MRVILLEDVKKQGKKGETINVKDGYGNYLINSNKAVLETKGSKKVLDSQNKKKELEDNKLLNEALDLKKKLEKITLEFKVNTGKDGQVFGSISSKQICDSLKEKGFSIDKRKIKIDGVINSLGFTDITVKLHKSVTGTLKIHLSR